MSIVTVSSRGRIQLSREILDHLRVSAGCELELLKTPDGHLVVKKPALDMTIDQFLRQLIMRVEPNDEDEENKEGQTDTAATDE